MTVESHLVRRSRNGDGRNKVDGIERDGVDIAAIDGGMGFLDDSATVDMSDGGREGERGKIRTTGCVLYCPFRDGKY